MRREQICRGLVEFVRESGRAEVQVVHVGERAEPTAEGGVRLAIGLGLRNDPAIRAVSESDTEFIAVERKRGNRRRPPRRHLRDVVDVHDAAEAIAQNIDRSRSRQSIPRCREILHASVEASKKARDGNGIQHRHHRGITEVERVVRGVNHRAPSYRISARMQSAEGELRVAVCLSSRTFSVRSGFPDVAGRAE